MSLDGLSVGASEVGSRSSLALLYAIWEGKDVPGPDGRRSESDLELPAALMLYPGLLPNV